MKLLCVIGQMGAGGAERVMATLVNHVAGLGWDVTLHHFQGKNHKSFYPLDPRVEVLHIDYHEKRPRTIKDYAILFIKSFLLIRRFIKKERPDIVFSSISGNNILTLMSTLGLGCPIIVHEASDMFAKHINFLLNFLRKIFYKKAKRIVVLSEKERIFFRNHSMQQVVSIPCSVQVLSSKTSYSTLKKIVTVGRLNVIKDHITLIKAFSVFVKQFLDYELHIYGDGPFRSQTEQLIQELQLENNVILKGNVDNPAQYLADYDMFMMSSLTEGVSNAVLEALSIGLPLVATDKSICNIPEIEHEKNALIVPVCDIEAMARAMERMACDAELRERFGKAGLAVATNYDHAKIMKKWENLFEEVARNK